MNQMKSIAGRVVLVAGAAMIAAEPAFAGFPVPGPVLGAGLPALAAIAGGYYLLRRYRAR